MPGLTHASTIPRAAETRPRWRVPSALRSFSRNGGAVVGTALLLAWVLAAIFAPLVAPYDPLDPVGPGRAAPSAQFWFGTDLLGRDIFSRVIYGARISLGLGVISVGIGLTLGVLMGLPAGYYGRWVDSVVMRVIDAMLAFPGLLLALLVIASLGPGLQNVMLAVGISSIPIYARLVRGTCLTVRELDYVTAARVVGGSDLRIMAQHILPNLVGPLIILSTLQIGSAILVGSSLSYLGMGAQPPTPEWGLMTADGRSYLARQWWMSTFPGLAIFSVVMAVNLMGDGLRTALDPRTRRR
jgi:peptide/nickel transport system permease protein